MREFRKALAELYNFERRVMDLGDTLHKQAAEDVNDGNDPYGDSGGNFDDAFRMGFETGQTRLAQEILKKYNTLFPKGVK